MSVLKLKNGDQPWLVAPPFFFFDVSQYVHLTP